MIGHFFDKQEKLLPHPLWSIGGVLFVCCFALLSGCAAPPQTSVPQHQHYRTVHNGVAPHKTIKTDTVKSADSKSVPELYQPWDLGQFGQQNPYRQSPYRLVSDVQEKQAPPPVNTERLLQVPSASSATLPQSPFPILNVGRDLVNEFRPLTQRKWSPNHAVQPTAVFNGNWVTMKNIRYTKYESPEKFTPRYYDATYDLDGIRTIDLIVVPFRAAPSLAHVQASFGFADGRQIGFSIEARYEEGEKYDALGSAMRQFELIYIFADERDLIRIGTDVNKNDVHIYRLKFTPKEVRTMFVDALQRANKLAKQPEFYHPLTNSCVTNLIAHINKGRPKAVPREYRTLLPGLMDNYVFDLKLVDTAAKDFKTAKENAKVNWLVEKYGDLEYFSAGIRQNMY
jgi:hypothetical protein